MTSVKRFRVDREPTDDQLGRGAFVFTDDYSVFDWGAMPDEIPEKGKSLCTMGAYSFELLEAEGLDTHYRGVVGAAGEAVELDAAEAAPREMAIDLTAAPPLPHDGRDYDYDAFFAATGDHYLIPLEIVFRNRVPVGSSLRRRTEPADHGLEVDAWPDEPIELDEPIIEFSTKFEAADRYLDRADADRIAGAADLGELEEIARRVNRVVTELAADGGLVHEDGKIECLYDDGTIRVADVVGTLDENRFSYEGRQLSKEVVRQFYKREQPDWVDAVADAKAEARARDSTEWRALVGVEPMPLPPRILSGVADLYRAGANAYTGRDWFEAPGLPAALGAVEAA
ncbi:MAG: phosphoribosylaminoimidazolesuccinocarboxamide synthase [Halobacteriales archaeon]|nr:phosphoribosylaminoimidazolesuccinocarboxamide synthase [Halobacteriales archaeon]